ncbi:MAG: transcriptional repressor [Planctomycetota bacterium]|nr:transcriptional repressor [Planctomycetota bacterium]
MAIRTVASTDRKNKSQLLTVESARELLRNASLRSTPSRLAVLEYLSAQERPISHAEISDKLVPMGFDKSTLFRVLTELAESDLLSRIDAGDHAWRFEIKGAGGHSPGDHPHFMCNDCGKVECMPEVQVSLKTKGKAPAKPRQIDSVFLKGTCGDCGA